MYRVNSPKNNSGKLIIRMIYTAIVCKKYVDSIQGTIFVWFMKIFKPNSGY